jgi:hypothetical protein
MAETHLIHEKAPELLLDKISELRDIVFKHKIKNPGGDGLKFYEDLLKVMQYAFRYMKETGRMHERNLYLEGLVRTFAEENQRLWKKVEAIETLSRMEEEGTLEKGMETARAYTDHVLSIQTQKKQLTVTTND